MEYKRFGEVFEEVVAKCRKLLVAKNREYARGSDKLHNFKRAAAAREQTQEYALGGMMLKHTISIYDMIDDIEAGESHPVEKWEEKVVDHINYLILLYAMVVESEDG